LAKKQKVLKEEIKVKENINPDELFEIAKSKGYDALGRLGSVSLIQDWLRTKHYLYTEIFFSVFHKKWSLNNYIIDLKTLKKIERPTKVVFYDEYNDALCQAIDEILQLI
jgi:hypothetical protein